MALLGMIGTMTFTTDTFLFIDSIEINESTIQFTDPLNKDNQITQLIELINLYSGFTVVSSLIESHDNNEIKHIQIPQHLISKEMNVFGMNDMYDSHFFFTNCDVNSYIKQMIGLSFDLFCNQMNYQNEINEMEIEENYENYEVNQNCQINEIDQNEEEE